MSEHIYLLTILLVVLPLLAMVAMKYFAAIVQARATVAQEERYRSLAEQTLTIQQEQADHLASLRADLSALRASLAVVENILKQVG
jgi:Tfp pilus assembly protein PilO